MKIHFFRTEKHALGLWGLMIRLGERQKIVFRRSSGFELSGGVLLVLNPSTPATCFGGTVRGFRQFKSGVGPDRFIWAR